MGIRECVTGNSHARIFHAVLVMMIWITFDPHLIVKQKIFLLVRESFHVETITTTLMRLHKKHYYAFTFHSVISLCHQHDINCPVSLMTFGLCVDTTTTCVDYGEIIENNWMVVVAGKHNYFPILHHIMMIHGIQTKFKGTSL